MAACKDGSSQHFFNLGADRCSCCGWNRFDKTAPTAVERDTMVHTRLAALHGRSTKYELVLVHDDGRKLLLAYGRKTRPGVLAMVHRQAVELSQFCGADYAELSSGPGDRRSRRR